ncbi:MAG: O-antigen ligase family protein [Burkholderiales bacterium]
MWSEYLYLIAVAVAMFITVDPFAWRLNHIAEVKHLALLLTIPAVTMSLTGRQLRQEVRGSILARVVKEAWPLAVLALIVILGGTYTRLIEGVRETLINVGLSMSFLFFAAAMVLTTKAPDAMLRAYFRILLIGALVMSAYLIVNYKVWQVYHVEIFLVVPLAVYCALVLKNKFLRTAGTAFFLAMAIFSVKNTAYLVALLVLLYLGYGFWLPRLLRTNPLKRFSGYYLMLVALLMLGGVLLFLLANRQAYLPSGSVDFRLYYYALAWDKFLDSPLWGSLFTGSSVAKFALHETAAGGILPTHSDVIDLLAFGGVLAIALWLYGLYLIARAGNRSLLNPSDYEHPWTPYAHSLAVMSLAAIISYSVNPVLTLPGLAFFVWSNLGLLLGLSMRAPKRPDVVPPQAEFTRARFARH